MSEAEWLNDFVFKVEEFLSPQECSEYIQISEDYGYEDALVNAPEGTVRRTDVRNNQRVIFKNQMLAEQLWDRTEEHVPCEYDERRALGLNEMFRFYRYDPGQQFDWHQDMPYERDNGEMSLFTMLIYLSEDFEGGETSFEDSYSDDSFDAFRIEPSIGCALFFVHETHHKGEPVFSGRKYVLRTDVMYSAEDPN